MTSARARAIYGCASTALAPEEREFFRHVRPWGFILFERNISGPEQVRALTAQLRETVADTRTPILIDQEGGRVARLKPPHWKERPAAERFAELHTQSPEAAREAVYLNSRLMAHDLTALGINVDCMPVLDVPAEGAHDIIGDRAYGRDPTVIIDLARTAIDGMIDGGVLPVMKHIPGHGRANADSHLSLPRVSAKAEELSATDFVTFRSLNNCPFAMTAHVVYEGIDPQRPATTSPKVIRDIVRGEIGFDGLLMSDDLSMKALSGTLGSRAKASLFAGCDVVLHCNGDMREMRQVAEELKNLEDIHLRRAEAALAHLAPPGQFDAEAGEARLAAILGARI